MSLIDLSSRSVIAGKDIMANFNKLLSTSTDVQNVKFGTLATTETATIGGDLYVGSGRSVGLNLASTTQFNLIDASGAVNMLQFNRVTADWNAVFNNDVSIPNGGLSVGGGFLNLGASTELTIATGAVTATKSYHTIDTESDSASDNLDTINGGTVGDILILSCNHDARTVVITNDGNIRTKAGTSITMDSLYSSVTLIYKSTNVWVVISTNA